MTSVCRLLPGALVAAALSACNMGSSNAPSGAPTAARPSSATVVDPSKARVSADDCGPEIAGIDRLSGRSAILFGELHGLTATPAFALDAACRLSIRDAAEKGATLVLEIPDNEQGRIDTFLASSGAASDKAALLAGPFWTGVKDGRSSVARVEMLEKARVLVQSGLRLRVIAMDDSTGLDQAPREAAMAKRIVSLVGRKEGPVVVLVGNLHARTVPGAEWAPDLRWMGVIVRDSVSDVLALDNRYGAGEAWVCIGPCGRKSVKGKDMNADGGASPRGWAIDLNGAPDEVGMHGVYHIGPARPSDPAVP